MRSGSEFDGGRYVSNGGCFSDVLPGYDNDKMPGKDRWRGGGDTTIPCSSDETWQAEMSCRCFAKRRTL